MSWSVRAQVVDIRTDTPHASDVIWIDTNIWIWLTYAGPQPPQSAPYIRYIASLKKIKASMAAGSINLAELAAHIEHTELLKWQARNGRPADSRELKVFRWDAAQRRDVVDEIGRCWRAVQGYANLPANAIQSTCVTRAAESLESGDLVDGGDAVMLADARRNGITSVLTDDADFATVEWITLFTANLKTINEARTTGKLILR